MLESSLNTEQRHTVSDSAGTAERFRKKMKGWNMTIRYALPDDLEEIAAVEAACFPEEKAATKQQIRDRLEHWADHFWLMFLDGKLISFIDGMATDSETLSDEMYADAGLHEKDGDWQMIFGVCTLPEYRGRGYASMLMEKAVSDSRERGRKGVVLTCLENMIPFYCRLGFREEGVSESVHGGAKWVQMKLVL